MWILDYWDEGWQYANMYGTMEEAEKAEADMISSSYHPILPEVYTRITFVKKG